MLPIAEYPPFRFCQFGIGLDVAFLVSPALFKPELGVARWCLVVRRAPVPEASIDEHCDFRAREDDVGSPAYVTDRSDRYAIPKTESMQTTTYGEFMGGVTATIRLHRGACAWRAHPGFGATKWRVDSPAGHGLILSPPQ